MTNIEINNEVVLLRKAVRQARICLINKLIREAKTLQTKRGPDALVQKYKKRAEKLLKEVHAVRLVKDDQISRFGIMNYDRLQALVENPKTDDRTRVIAKVAKFKILSARIALIKTKFPDCEELFAAKKKKRGPVKQKTAASAASAASAAFKRKQETEEKKPAVELIKVQNESTEDSANLHPSWAARKKEKEIMKQGFQGKKIVFDDC